MPTESLSSLTDQVVDLLRKGMISGRWRDSLPGRDRLASELGVSHARVEEAMRRLAKDGLLKSAGAGRRRKIVLPKKRFVPQHFRVRIFLYESTDRNLPELTDLLERLKKAGFSADFSSASLLDLGMDVKRVLQYVKKNPSDAWIIAAGSREVLEWFCEQPVPAYALCGVCSGLPIAGCRVRYEIQPILQRLLELGHRRIVLLTREEHVTPKPSMFAQQFLDALQSAGITPSSYNLPGWGFDPGGLHRCLESLFKLTPPTALITSEARIMLAVRDHLAQRGIIAPRKVSLISLEEDTSFSWLDPLMSHFQWDFSSSNRRIVQWAKNVAPGKDDRRQTFITANFNEGGTIGPVNGKG